MVAEVPLYKPKMPFVRSNSLVMLIADIFFAAAAPSGDKNLKKKQIKICTSKTYMTLSKGNNFK